MQRIVAFREIEAASCILEQQQKAARAQALVFISPGLVRRLPAILRKGGSYGPSPRPVGFLVPRGQAHRPYQSWHDPASGVACSRVASGFSRRCAMGANHE